MQFDACNASSTYEFACKIDCKTECKKFILLLHNKRHRKTDCKTESNLHNLGKN